MPSITITADDWQYFSTEERTRMQKAIDQGQFGQLIDLVSFGNPLTARAKEAVISKIKGQLTPQFTGFESKVRKALNKELNKSNDALSTPEKVEEWDLKLRNEAQEWREKMEAQSKERQEEIQKVLKIAEEKKKERAASEKIKAELSEIKVEEVKTPEDKVEGFKVEEVKKVGRPKKIKAE